MSECESTCDSEAMAVYDAKQWNNYNACLLPQGSGTVSLESSAPDIYAITVSWKTNMEIEAESFVFEFQP